MNARAEPLLSPCIINKRSLDPFRGGDCCDGRNNTRHHAGQQVVTRRQGARRRIRKGLFDLVEEEETHGIFPHRSKDEGAAAFVQRSQTLFFVDSTHHQERIAWRRQALFLPQLHSGLCELKWILSGLVSLDLRHFRCFSRHTVMNASMPPAIPPAVSETTAGVFLSWQALVLAASRHDRESLLHRQPWLVWIWI